MQVYFDQGIHNKHAVTEVYFRQQPFKNGYAVAGPERSVKYLENLEFFWERYCLFRMLVIMEPSWNISVILNWNWQYARQEGDLVLQ